MAPAAPWVQIFPAVAADGKLFAMALDGYWMDVGQPKDYLAGAQRSSTIGPDALCLLHALCLVRVPEGNGHQMVCCSSISTSRDFHWHCCWWRCLATQLLMGLLRLMRLQGWGCTWSPCGRSTPSSWQMGRAFRWGGVMHGCARGREACMPGVAVPGLQQTP